MPQILPTLDVDLGGELLKVFKQRGIQCYLDTKVEEMKLVGGAVSARLSSGELYAFDRVLVATGRRPNTSELGLDRAGIRTDRRGFVEVNNRLETSAVHHYTIGDANGRSMLAHAASAQGVAAAENALGHAKPLNAAIPSAVYTFPEVAWYDGARSPRRRTADLDRPLPGRASRQGDGCPAPGRFRKDDSPP
jgi:dihydrolipoamide dehydrogenase